MLLLRRCFLRMSRRPMREEEVGRILEPGNEEDVY